MLFNQIVIIDPAGLTAPEMEEMQKYSRERIVAYDTIPSSDDEILARVGDSDAVLVSWRTQVSEEVIARFLNVKYIGMCCSLYDEKSANVAILAAKSRNIVVKGVRDYGDEGTVEFVFAQLIALFKGFYGKKWRTEIQELKGKSMGVIGMGTLGRMVAQTALHFGMQVFYYSRSKKDDLIGSPIHYLSLEDLVAQCDVISTHLPKNTAPLDVAMLKKKKRNSILINTSLGLTFDKEALLDWLDDDPTSFAIFDQEGAGGHWEEFSAHSNIIVYPNSSGSTIEAKKRLSQKVLDNIKVYMEA